MSQLLSRATIASVGLTCKAALKLGLFAITVKGLPNLLDALEDNRRENGQGIITFSNHISTLDDPLVWGVLPARNHLRPRMMRWTLGASDILFTNPVFSTFFRHGQVIETFRGKGVYQHAVNLAIDKLNGGDWVHFFPEGKVNPSSTHTADASGNVVLPRFKWGIGKVIGSANKCPTVIPMWLTGFDNVMPEGRSFPYKLIPRVGHKLSVTFGEAIPISHLEHARTASQHDEVSRRTRLTSITQHTLHALGSSIYSTHKR